MDKEWVEEERRLWDEMHRVPKIRESRKWARVIARAKREHRDVKALEKRLGLVSADEAATRSWRAYRAWIGHQPP